MKASSQDLRQRVLFAFDQGDSQAEVAETFAISVSTIKRGLKTRRETGLGEVIKPDVSYRYEASDLM